MQDLGLAKDAIFPQNTSPAARNRYLYYPDHLVRMPHPSFGIIDNVRSLWSEPVFDGTIWGSLTEFLKQKRGDDVSDESVGSFFSRRFDARIVDRILSGVLHGIYAGDAWQLSAKSLFPAQWRDEANTGGVFSGLAKTRSEGLEITRREGEFLQSMRDAPWDPLLKETLRHTTAFTFREGLAMLSDGLARFLMGSGKVNFRTSSPVEAMRVSSEGAGVTIRSSDSVESSYANVVSSVSPSHLNKIHLNGPQTQALVPRIPAVTVMTVNLFYRTPDLVPPGFGYLIPQATSFENNPERALGVVFDNAYSPSPDDVKMQNWHVQSAEELQEARKQGRLINVNDFAWYNMPDKPNIQDHLETPGTKLTVMLGGHHWDGWPAYPDEQEGLAMAKALLERHVGIKEEPEAWQVNLQKDCIPQYTVGHEQRLVSARDNIQQAYNGKLRVAGNWMSGVGVNDCLRSAWDVAQSLKDRRQGTGLEHVGTKEFFRLKVVTGRQSSQE